MLRWLQKPKMTKVLEMYLENARLAHRTVKLTEHAWGQMVEIAGDIPINRFSTETAARVQKRWASPRNYRKATNPIFNWAVTERLIKANPFEGIRVPKATKRVVRVYSADEFRQMLDSCQYIQDTLEWLTVLIVARTTGMRKSAIQNLTKDEIDFDREVINIKEKFETDSTWSWKLKDREERTVPLAKEAAKFLTELIYTRPQAQPYVILKVPRYYHLLEQRELGMLSEDTKLTPISNFDRIFRKIKKRANVKGRFHDLRATCLTDLSCTLNPSEVMRISGHSDIVTLMKYIGVRGDIVDKARRQVNQSLAADNQSLPAL